MNHTDTTSQTAPGAPTTIYYDGGCPVCSREIGFYEGRTGDAIAYVDITASDGDPASDLTRDAALARLHARLADGTLVSGAAAFVELWRNVPVLRHVAPILASRPLLPLVELGYRGLLMVRKLWR